MIWSVSASRTFKRCQRQWYYKNCVANANAKKDPIRRKAYLLSKLQSISAWRGKIVEAAIERGIIPAINNKHRITLADTKRIAKRIFDLQLAYARKHPLHEPNLSIKKAGLSFAVFYCMEYNGVIHEDDINTAWSEIELSLLNLFRMRDLCNTLKSAKYVITQPKLTFSSSDVTVRAVPDLIAFFKNQPPLIVDWKVHAFGIQEAWLQLGIYGLASMRCNWYIDSLGMQRNSCAEDLRMSEVQLLTNKIRDYTLTDEDTTKIDSYITESSNQMLLAIRGRSNTQLKPSDFTTTIYPDNCQRCAFRSLCL